MFAEFYGLSRDPFGALSPGHIFLGPTYRKVLAELYYGIESGNAMQLLIGDSGLGKTILLQCLAQRVRGRVRPLMLASADLHDRELLANLIGNLKCDAAKFREASYGPTSTLARNEKPQGKSAVLLVDDAHLLCASELSDLLQLGNSVAVANDLRGIVLGGRPELLAKLKPRNAGDKCREIWINGLSATETGQYISHRLHLARGSRAVTFTAAAASVIARRSDGVPQRINELCVLALTKGAKLGKTPIDGAIVDGAHAALYEASPQVSRAQANIATTQLSRELLSHLPRAWPLIVLILIGGAWLWFERAGLTQILTASVSSPARSTEPAEANSADAAPGASLNHDSHFPFRTSASRSTQKLVEPAQLSRSSEAWNSGSKRQTDLTGAQPDAAALRQVPQTHPSFSGSMQGAAIALRAPALSPMQSTVTAKVLPPLPGKVPAGARHRFSMVPSDAMSAEEKRQLGYDMESGDAYMRLGQYDKAAAAYQAALALSPHNEQIERKIERVRRAKTTEEQILGAS